MFPLVPTNSKLVPQKNQGINLISLLFFFILLLVFSKKSTAETNAKDFPAADTTPTLDPPDFFGTVFGVSVKNLMLSILDRPITRIEQSLTQKIPEEEYGKAIELCNEAIAELLAENSWFPKGQWVKDIKDGGLIIMFIPHGSVTGHESTPNYAFYHAERGHVYLVYSSELTKDDYKKKILNEMFPHFVMAAHKRCGFTSIKDWKAVRTRPFLNEDGKIDSVLKDSLIKSIQSGLEQIANVKKLWDQRTKKKLDASEKALLVQFIAAVKHWTPYTYFIPADNIQSAIAAGWYQMVGNHIESGPNYPANFPPFYNGRIKDGYIAATRHKSYTLLRDRIDDFFYFISSSEKLINNPQTLYHQRGENNQWEEFASFIVELPEPLLDLFFKDFCSLIQQYLLRCKPEEEKEASQRSAEVPRDYSFFPKEESSKNKWDNHKPAFKPQPNHEKHEFDKPSFQRKSLHR